MRVLILITGILISFLLSGQELNRTIVPGKIDGRDTLVVVDLNEIHIMSFQPTDDKRDLRRLNRLIRNVKKAYPYAKLAGILLKDYEVILADAESDKERKQIIRQAEEELKEEFEDDLRNLTISQGKILIKLVDRETGNTSYDLVRQLRGSFRAFFYQTFARIFGYDLKDRYDPGGEDNQIEFIVRMIETGQI